MLNVVELLPTLEVIEPAQWLDDDLYPNYHANKDFIARWKRKEHLQGEIKSVEQCIVRCYELGGVRVKLDGHSRSDAWRCHLAGQKKALAVPDKLGLYVYKVSTLEEVAALYRAFNSKDGAETPNEMMQHFNRLLDYKPQSLFMRSQWKSVYVCLHPRYDKNEYHAIAEYKDELLTLDGWDVPFKSKSTKLSVGIRAAMVVSVRKNAELAKRFWDTYLDDEDTTSAEVNQLRDVMVEYKGKLGGARVVGMVYGIAKGLFDTYVDKQQ